MAKTSKVSKGAKQVWTRKFAHSSFCLLVHLSLYDICLVIRFFQIGCKIKRLVLWMS